MAQKNSKDQKPDSPKEGLTPLMQQYRDIKARYPGMILFFRLGDFYEMFGEDAQQAAPVLELVLTRRQDVPMCGVPYHASAGYIRRLIRAGRKVAICEQLEDPAGAKGIVKRGVVRVITPGTVLEDNLLEAKRNNFLAAAVPSENGERAGLAWVDISTGEFGATETAAGRIEGELFRLDPGEVVVPESRAGTPFAAALERRRARTCSTVPDWSCSLPESTGRIQQTFRIQSLKPLGLDVHPLAAMAAGAVLSYIENTQIGRLPALGNIRYYSLDDYMVLDETAVRNLELLEGSASRSAEHSLMAAIDATQTAMGGRMLRQWLIRPLLSVENIRRRQQSVGYFVDEGMARRQVREALQGMADIERVVSRTASGSVLPRELNALKSSLQRLGGIQALLRDAGSLGTVPSGVDELAGRLDEPAGISDLIAAAVADEPAATLKEGGVIRAGYDAGLDELRTLGRDARSLISSMEARERERSGIATLKIGYTSVFGYFIEVTRANIALVPADYIRKQTLTGCERFITPELKTFEEKILSAEEKSLRLEQELYRGLLAGILKEAPRLQSLASALAELDLFVSLAEIAVANHYSCPTVDESHELAIKDGRHPVIERSIRSGAFVANDTALNGGSDQIILLTGPNMAGKSTYLRQIALIVILAHIGSYVPCAEARIGLVDRIFTRIGSGDNLAGGESTFMVEMHEVASILNQFTPRSLIILDEVGRGTSTYDGISIARSVVEYLAGSGRGGAAPKVVFATHYFELTELAETFPGIRNYNVSVKEWQHEVVFLHKIVPGAADRSYGIHVARLAGLPEPVIRRASRVLEELETAAAPEARRADDRQLDLFAAAASPRPQIMLELEALDVNAMTPLDALKLIAEWKKTSASPQEKNI